MLGDKLDSSEATGGDPPPRNQTSSPGSPRPRSPSHVEMLRNQATFLDLIHQNLNQPETTENNFIRNLERQGYFKGFEKGSEEYNARLEHAKERFQKDFGNF